MHQAPSEDVWSYRKREVPLRRRHLRIVVATWTMFALSMLAACGNRTSPSNKLPRGPSFEARMTLLNKSHELQQVRIRHLADDVSVDCEDVAEAPGQYLTPGVFGETRIRDMYSGQQFALGVDVPGTSPPVLERSECRAALVSVDVAPDVIVFWDDSVRAKSFVRNPRGSKSELGGSQTVVLNGDYSAVDSGGVRSFRYRPCREDGICGTAGRQEASRIPDGATYSWSQPSGPKRFWKFPNENVAGDDPPELCRRLLERDGLDWDAPPTDERRVVDVENGGDGCHTVRWRIPDTQTSPEPYPICAPWEVVSKLHPSSESARVLVEVKSTTDYDHPKVPHAGIEISLTEEDASGATLRRGRIFLTRGTGGLPTLADAELRPSVPSGCVPREESCGRTVVPAFTELSTDDDSWRLEPGKRVRIDADRSVHTVRSVYRPVSRGSGACGTGDPPVIDRVLGDRTGVFLEAATIVGFDSSG